MAKPSGMSPAPKLMTAPNNVAARGAGNSAGEWSSKTTSASYRAKAEVVKCGVEGGDIKSKERNKNRRRNSRSTFREIRKAKESVRVNGVAAEILPVAKEKRATVRMVTSRPSMRASSLNNDRNEGNMWRGSSSGVQRTSNAKYAETESRQWYLCVISDRPYNPARRAEMKLWGREVSQPQWLNEGAMPVCGGAQRRQNKYIGLH